MGLLSPQWPMHSREHKVKDSKVRVWDHRIPRTGEILLFIEEEVKPAEAAPPPVTTGIRGSPTSVFLRR